MYLEPGLFTFGEHLAQKNSATQAHIVLLLLVGKVLSIEGYGSVKRISPIQNNPV